MEQREQIMAFQGIDWVSRGTVYARAANGSEARSVRSNSMLHGKNKTRNVRDIHAASECTILLLKVDPCQPNLHQSLKPQATSSEHASLAAASELALPLPPYSSQGGPDAYLPWVDLQETCRCCTADRPRGRWDT